MTKTRFVCVSVLALLVLAAAGCRQQVEQVAVEQQSLERLIGLLRIHAIEFPSNRTTNFAVVFTDLRRPYPYGLHQKFKSFKKHAGFENSFYEKYVFVPPGLTNRSVHGEILLLNAEPFPDRTGKSGRMILSKLGEGHQSYKLKWMAEERIQSLFAEMGVNIPKPVPMPAPPPPPPPDQEFPDTIWSVTAKYFDIAAALLGLGWERGGQLQWFTFMLLATVTVLWVPWMFWNWLRRRRRTK